MLTKSIAYIQCTEKPLTLETAKKLLMNDIRSQIPLSISVELIQKVVAEYFNVPLEDLKSKKKTKIIVLPRHIAMYLAREMTECSTTELGRAFGGKDHGSIINAYKKIEGQIISEPSIQTTILALQEKIKEKSNTVNKL